SSNESEDFNKGGGGDVCATKAISVRPQRRTVILDWPEHVKSDEKEEAIAFDVDGKRQLVRGPVQPRDVCNDRGLRYYVQFNDFNQPLRQGGSILVSFLGDVAKRETFCPIGVSSWHKLKKKMKADIVILVRVCVLFLFLFFALFCGEKEKGKFSELDFYKSVYTKKDGSFKEGTLSQQFLEDANNKVKECLASSSSKSRVDIMNEVFDDLMYNGEVAKRPLNYGFGVKQSDIFGKNQALETKFDDTAQSFKAIASHLAQVLKEVRNGNASGHLLDAAISAIKLIDT
ncbi:Glycosyltransferase 25 family member, partial [Bienertia sinuspersici]